jgi:hypothetical protein
LKQLVLVHFQYRLVLQLLTFLLSAAAAGLQVSEAVAEAVALYTIPDIQ